MPVAVCEQQQLLVQPWFVLFGYHLGLGIQTGAEFEQAPSSGVKLYLSRGAHSLFRHSSMLSRKPVPDPAPP